MQTVHVLVRGKETNRLKRHDMNLQTESEGAISCLPERYVLMDKNMWKTRKSNNKDGIGSDYALSSSYAILSFTEYPC